MIFSRLPHTAWTWHTDMASIYQQVISVQKKMNSTLYGMNGIRVEQEKTEGKRLQQKKNCRESENHILQTRKQLMLIFIYLVFYCINSLLIVCIRAHTSINMLHNLQRTAALH